MVRSLDSALINALNNVTRRPALSLTIEDHVIHYSLYQSPGTADAWNDACIASDNSIIRAQVTRGGSGFVSNFQFQRITDPSQAAQWATWTTLPGSAGLIFQDGGCAVANSGGTLFAFAQRGTGGNNLWSWTSVNNGVTWTGPVSVLSPPGGALLKGIGSAGNNDVFFLYDVSGGEAIGCSFYAAGSWSALNTWTLPTIPYGAGLAVVWTSTIYSLVYSDGYSLASCVFNPSGSLWSSGALIAPATGTAIGRVAPRLSFADGLYTLTCIELDSGLLTGSVYSYPRLRQSADLVHWSNGLIAHDISCSLGAVAFKLVTPNTGNAGPRYYLASLATVNSAPAFRNASPTQFLDASASTLSYRRSEELGKPARLEVLLDNAQGAYNALVTSAGSYQPIGLNASMVLSEGYKTGTPPTLNDVVRVGVYRITQIHFVRSPEENQLLLIGQDLSRTLDLTVRYQNTYANQTLAYLVTEVCARAGLFALALPGTSQMSQVVATFVLQAGQSYRHALDELCTTYGLLYFLDQNEVLQFRELSSSDPSVWTYQPEIETVSFGSNEQRANHIIVSGKPPSGSLPAALTTAEAYDDAHMHLVGLERLLHHVDPKLTTTAQCSQKAAFLLAQEVRTQVVHTVTVPLNPALQALDGITLIDSAAPRGSGQSATCRIMRLQVHYDALSGVNALQLTLEGM
ncbi:MAG TPA: hypothetical protein VFB60_18690 [Ktedonobacteraceae bacterium]|nr:hypothetical protein [Ktedonobacteraceae bacterium]